MNTQALIQPQSEARVTPKGLLWTGYILSVLVVLFMLMDTAMHLAKPAPVVQAFAKLRYPLSLSVDIAVVELVCTFLYAIPKTSVLGAILLTGYLGGAVAVQLPIGGPYWFPIAMGVLTWLGLYMRDDRLRALVPCRSATERPNR